MEKLRQTAAKLSKEKDKNIYSIGKKILEKICRTKWLSNQQWQLLTAGCGPAGVLILNKQEVIAIDPLLDAYNESISFSKVLM